MSEPKRKLRDRITLTVAAYVLYWGCSRDTWRRVQRAINLGYHEMNVNGFGEQITPPSPYRDI